MGHERINSVYYDRVSAVYKNEKDNRRLIISYEESPESPREWDNLGVIFSSKRSRYYFGDRDLPELYDLIDFDRLPLSEYEWKSSMSSATMAALVERQGAVVLDVYMYAHGGLALNTTGFSCPWDSCQIGFIVATSETIRKEYKCKRISKKLRKRVQELLKAEIAELNEYVGGTVLEYVIEDADGEILDSCGGFYGGEKNIWNHVEDKDDWKEVDWKIVHKVLVIAE